MGLTVLMYLVATARSAPLGRWAPATLLAAFVVHALLLVADIAGLGLPGGGARLGFGPVLSMTAWLVVAVYTVESRMLPLPSVRRWLGPLGALAVLAAAVFPGATAQVSSSLAPLHFALGVASYGLFGSAVLHGLMLDAAERRLRAGHAGQLPAASALTHPTMPLLQLERLTFNFVAAGFAALTATLVLGLATSGHWQADHKTVFAILAWLVFAALLAGRRWRGWRGKHATRWLYAGAVLLLLAYVGSRFVMGVVLGR